MAAGWLEEEKVKVLEKRRKEEEDKLRLQMEIESARLRREAKEEAESAREREQRKENGRQMARSVRSFNREVQADARLSVGDQIAQVRQSDFRRGGTLSIETSPPIKRSLSYEGRKLVRLSSARPQPRGTSRSRSSLGLGRTSL